MTLKRLAWFLLLPALAAENLAVDSAKIYTDGEQPGG